MPRKGNPTRRKPKVKADRRTANAGHKNLIPIKKGERPVGRRKGTPNKVNKLVKDAIVEAATLLGRDGKGKQGLVGYMMWLARIEPAVYGRLLEKVMPMQLEVKDTTKKLYTADEARQALEERGLPVPQSLADLAMSAVQAREDHDDEPQDNSEFEDLAPDTPEIYSEDELGEGGDPDDEEDDDQEAA